MFLTCNETDPGDVLPDLFSCSNMVLAERARLAVDGVRSEPAGEPRRAELNMKNSFAIILLLSVKPWKMALYRSFSLFILFPDFLFPPSEQTWMV